MKLKRTLFLIVALSAYSSVYADIRLPEIQCVSRKYPWLATAQSRNADWTPVFASGCYRDCSAETISVEATYVSVSNPFDWVTLKLSVPPAQWPLRRGWSGQGTANRMVRPDCGEPTCYDPPYSESEPVDCRVNE